MNRSPVNQSAVQQDRLPPVILSEEQLLQIVRVIGAAGAPPLVIFDGKPAAAPLPAGEVRYCQLTSGLPSVWIELRAHGTWLRFEPADPASRALAEQLRALLRAAARPHAWFTDNVTAPGVMIGVGIINFLRYRGTGIQSTLLAAIVLIVGGAFWAVVAVRPKPVIRIESREK
jgi:hypothetical protein